MNEMNLMDYPFDLYQRSRDIREIVEIIEKELIGKVTGETDKPQLVSKLKILDVGGFRIEADDRDTLLLREFIPGHDIIALDMIESSIPGYIQGDGSNLPFKDESFDIVVSSDVYEHVPRDRRNDFIENLVRVSKHFVILGAPFYSPKNELAEKIVFEFVRKVLHAEQEQLKEHIENRLPSADELNSSLHEKELDFISFNSGNLNSWLLMMILKHYLMSIPETRELDGMIDRFYNMSFFEGDHGGEGYRKVFVIAKTQKGLESLKKIEGHFATYAEMLSQQRLDTVDMAHVRMLIDLEALRTRALFDEKDALIKHQAAQIAAFNHMRSTRVYRLMQAVNGLTVSPILHYSRLFLGKMQQVGMVLTGKRRHILLSLSDRAYRRWLKKNEPSRDQYAGFKSEIGGFKLRPLISIVVPAYNTPGEFLAKAVDSVLNQVYENWELCIVNDGSPEKHVAQILDVYGKKDGRIHVKHLPKNKGIARATNEAISMASGEFIAFMDSDDALHPLALFEMVKFINKTPDADFIFSDEDKLTLDDKRRRPEFKPGWNPGLFLTYNYLNHLTVCRKGIIDELGGFRAKYNWSQDYDLYLRITEKTDRIYHLPKVLYHWREIPNSSASKVDIRPVALAKSIELLTETLQRRGINGVVKKGLRPGTFKIIKR